MRLRLGRRGIWPVLVVVLVAGSAATVAWFRTLPPVPRSISNDVQGAYLDDYATFGLNTYDNNQAESTLFDSVSYTHTPPSCSVEGRLVTHSDIGGRFFTTAPGVPARHFTVGSDRHGNSRYLVIVVHADHLARCRITRANYHVHHWGIPVTRSFEFRLSVDVTHPGAGPNAEPYNR